MDPAALHDFRCLDSGHGNACGTTRRKRGFLSMARLLIKSTLVFATDNHCMHRSGGRTLFSLLARQIPPPR
ncbi:hypothetical protein LF1_54650 [Rubripirellula obstinata]|uniref:Uncharacterized protein n=1 Tax=Rubripirellula obstinata TaxID=406547 RepID=A0A5B1C9X1_9BACT|nr:hypothetical protein LF1_55860 [Rubripirellula obstinata]KAA1257316.1 hypothetical protein LF1_54650 [Rubripirellula obstinata]